jgi:hypothetical protein
VFADNSYLRTGALRDPDFGRLWRDVARYGRQLEELQVTDKYVAAHAIGDDAGDERLVLPHSYYTAILINIITHWCILLELCLSYQPACLPACLPASHR